MAAVAAGAVLPRKPVVWEDLSTGRFHAINNETGEKVPCDRNGRPLAQFHLNVSGTASTKERMTLRLKDTALQKSLMTPAPGRPKPYVGEKLLELKEDRVETKGRFRSKLTTEAGLFVKQQKETREAYPELERERLEEEAKAKHKIDELHKNFYALQASNEVAGGKGSAAPAAAADKPAFKNLSRSEYFSFTATGVYRP